MFGYYSLKDGRDAQAMRAHGGDATAAITGFHATVGSDHTISYLIDLAWRDGSGAERHFGPTHISNSYAQRIAANGPLITRQTTIRYREADRSARPIVVADAGERAAQDGIGRVMTAVFGFAGLALAAVTTWQPSGRERIRPRLTSGWRRSCWRCRRSSFRTCRASLRNASPPLRDDGPRTRLSSVRPWPAISLRKLFRTPSLIKNGGIRGPLSDCGRASSGFAEPPCKPISRHRHSLMCRLDQVDVSTENR
jgi:hypothetical protein